MDEVEIEAVETLSDQWRPLRQYRLRQRRRDGTRQSLVREVYAMGPAAAVLPHDAYQLALILHPNERARLGDHDLTELLNPALEAGLLLAAPFEEWAAVLVAADAVVTDHGSTALYAAALDRPIVAAYDGGDELIPGSPMDQLLSRSPRLDSPTGLEAALGAHRPGIAREIIRRGGRAI